jgi:hypothetical protein
VKLARAFPFFSSAFVICYALSVQFNLALFTYHPQLRQFAFLVEPPKAGPAMYWYGWLATSALGALLVSAIALALPRQPTMRIWSGIVWLVPIGGIIFFFYLLQGYFLR